MALTKAEKQLKTVLALLTKGIDNLDLFLRNFNEPDGSLYQELLMRLNQLQDTHNKAQDLIFDLEHDNELHTLSEEPFDKYLKVSSKAKFAVAQFKTLDPEYRPISPVPSCASTNSVEGSFTFKLPELKLPQFDGNYLHWPKFRDIFQNAIIDSPNLTDSVKFCYLLGCLKDDAKAILHNLEVSDSNFPVAWEILKRRFDCPRVIVSQHLTSILNPPELTPGSAVSLQKLIDFYNLHINALQALKEESDLSDLLLIALVTKGLPQNILREWELSIETENFPTFESLMKFLQHQQRGLSVITDPSTQSSKFDKSKSNKFHNKCPKCKSEHFLADCPEFLNLSKRDRSAFVESNNRCVKCLGYKGQNHSCQKSCSVCKQPHHQLLHFDKTSSKTPQSAVVSAVQANCEVLLPTARVKGFTPKGEPYYLNALLDTGSAINLITWESVKTLKLPTKKFKINIEMIGGEPMPANHVVQLKVQSCHENNPWSKTISLFVVPDLPTSLKESFNADSWNVPKDAFLADPYFNESKAIHVLFGADIFFETLLPCNKRRNNGRFPTLQETRLGWVIAGHTPLRPSPVSTTCSYMTANCELSQQLKRFWEVEEATPMNPKFSDDELAEAHFVATHKRDDSGRYIVCLPTKTEAPSLGNSKAQALKRFGALERRFEKDQIFKQSYQDFMNEYLELGHMRIAPPNSFNDSYYISHHAVHKPSSSTTKIRVVYDGSSKTTNGHSLNDILINGEKLQPDLFDTLINFRLGKIAIIADLEKMFRQVQVNPSDWHFQHILWRDSPSKPIGDYVLTTVTYGLKPATFLAVRTLLQLAKDERQNFPLGSEVLQKSFYVDDLLHSCDDMLTTKDTVNQLVEILAAGGFNLRKWASNCSEVLENLPQHLLAQSNERVFRSKEPENISTLGLSWNTHLDTLTIVLPDSIQNCKLKFTKRSMLSVICSLFDPLGVLAPFLIICKILFQKLWEYPLKWDDPIPNELAPQWEEIFTSLPDLLNITLPRCVIPLKKPVIQLHGFSDSSLTAYGAAIYVKTISEQGPAFVRLLCAKSKVVPSHMKAKDDSSLTIPRLELCAALLLARLMNRIKQNISSKVIIESLIYWTDSRVVLDWLKSPPLKGNIFVRNRAQSINELTAGAKWRHVCSASNPADLLTRGVHLKDLPYTTIWWTGPDFLTSQPQEWPPSHEIIIPHLSPVLACNILQPTYLQSRICNYYSSLIKAIRIMAYVLRFINLVTTSKTRGCNQSESLKGPLTVLEIERAELKCIQIVQQNAFPSEYRMLSKGNDCPHNSKLISLKPFIHTDGCLRVGGRLQEAELPFNTTHPLILPKSAPFVKTLIFHAHKELGHSSGQTLISHLRQRYWILSTRRAVKDTLSNCLVCFRHKPIPAQQLMANLPAVRVRQNLVFQSVGIDYTGHFLIRFGGPRSKAVSKVYLALFICMATRAVHIEIVSALTTSAFLMTLKRFVSRRGLPASIYSDNGTAFVGARGKLEALYKLLQSACFQEQISDFCTNSRIQWHFIPPRSPHCGGLWEANIKSMKHHLLRLMGDSIHSYEEMLTISLQVEAILNSRPIAKISDDPNDFDYLTPGHFLIGKPLTAIPEPQLLSASPSRLSQWSQAQRRIAQIWKRWSQDYLHTLQQRSKWTTVSPEVKLNTPVLLIEDNLPPLMWKLGVIIELYPGRDNRVRAVKVKTSTGAFVRHVNKLCPLPIEKTDVNIHSN